MKKRSILMMLLIISMLAFFIVGCSSESDKAGSGSSSSTTKTETKDNSTDTSNKTTANNTSNGSDSNENSNVYVAPVNEEEERLKGQLTGVWEVSTPLEDGNVSFVDVKIDNVNGFTLTTGTGTPEGAGSFYNRVGSYRLEGDHIFFMATTGGESQVLRSNDYNLRADPGVFEYTFSENPELTQLVLTPVNENAILLTGEGQLVLSKV